MLGFWSIFYAFTTSIMIREKLYTFFVSMSDLGSDMGGKNWLAELFPA